MSRITDTDIDLGVIATVVMDPETHGPRRLQTEGGGLREITVFPGPSEDFFVDNVVRPGTPNEVLALDSSEMEEPLVDEIWLVSSYSLHVALYALQRGTSEARERALELIGASGDVDGHLDEETLRPLPVSEPLGWSK